MYVIRFDFQFRQGMPDEEVNSIVLTDETYEQLPVLSYDDTFDDDTVFFVKPFSEQVRHSQKTFPAICVTNPKWRLREDDHYLDDMVTWHFVCLDKAKGIWIAFKYWDAATDAEAYGSTVSVSLPCHGPAYRLDEKCRNVIDMLSL